MIYISCGEDSNTGVTFRVQAVTVGISPRLQGSKDACFLCTKCSQEPGARVCRDRVRSRLMLAARTVKGNCQHESSDGVNKPLGIKSRPFRSGGECSGMPESCVSGRKES